MLLLDVCVVAIVLTFWAQKTAHAPALARAVAKHTGSKR